MINERNYNLEKVEYQTEVLKEEIKGIISRSITVTETKYEYQSQGNPKEFEGIDSIWNVILNAKNEQVVNQAILFLISLYLKVNEAENKTVLKMSFIQKCT